MLIVKLNPNFNTAKIKYLINKLKKCFDVKLLIIYPVFMSVLFKL